MTQPNPPVPDPTPIPPAAAQNTDPPKSDDNAVPYQRFAEVNTRAKAAEAELAQIKADREEAERKAAEKAGDWQKLANEHTATISDLKPKLKAAEETRDRYSAALEAHVKVLRKDVPEHIAGLLDRLDPVDQLEWITKNSDQITSNGAARGNGPNPKPSGQGSHETRVQENQNKLRATGAYNPF